MNPYIAILIMFLFAMVFAGGFLFLSWLLGPKKPTETKLSVYECGIDSVGSARERFSVKFYLVAILFIIFDIEVVFLYPWAVNFKKLAAEGDAHAPLVVVGSFMVLLTLGLVYAWKKQALDWSEKKSRRRV